ncbi:MAG: tetratricopeptide repeat protein, partial [Promethearchaeota archaeon]
GGEALGRMARELLHHGAGEAESHPEAGYYYRSDHFSFARVGVPAFSIDAGNEYVGKPKEFEKGLEAYYRRDFAKAVEYFEKARQKKPDDVGILRSLGFTQQLLGNYSRAHEILLKAFELHPNDSDAVLFLADSYLYMGDPSRAVEYAEKGLQLSPKEPASWTSAARIHLWCGNEEQGIQYAEKAIELDPKNKSYTFNILIDVGEFYIKRREYNKAIGVFNRLLTLDKHSLMALFMLGWIYLITEDTTNRIQAAENLIKLSKKSKKHDDDTKIAFKSFGFYLKGDFEMAVKEAKKSLRPKEISYYGWIALALAYYGKGEFTQSYEAFLRAQQLQAFDPVNEPFFIGIFEAVKQHR